VRVAFAILVFCLFDRALALADDRKTAADLDTAYQAAVKINDAATMDRILANDFILVEGALFGVIAGQEFQRESPSSSSCPRHFAL